MKKPIKQPKPIRIEIVKGKAIIVKNWLVIKNKFITIKN